MLQCRSVGGLLIPGERRTMNGNLEILREQLYSTTALLAHVQRAEMHFRNRHKAVAELLRCMSGELSNISILIRYRIGSALKGAVVAVCVDAIDHGSSAGGE